MDGTRSPSRRSCKKLLEEEKIESVGFISRTDIDWIGISPDGIIRNEEGKIIKAIEVKAPSPKIFVKYFLSDKIPDEYFWQVVHYFIILEDLKELDFIAYNPDFYAEKIRMKKILVTREELQESIQLAKTCLAEFYSEYDKMAQKFIEKSENN